MCGLCVYVCARQAEIKTRVYYVFVVPCAWFLVSIVLRRIPALFAFGGFSGIRRLVRHLPRGGLVFCVRVRASHRIYVDYSNSDENHYKT